mgnify:CR=1 FL=1
MKQIAAALTQCLHRPADLVSRYGGKEFVIVLPSIPPAEVQRVAEQINEFIEVLKIEHSGNSASSFVTASLGAVGGKPVPKTSYKHFLAAADEALYKAKNLGRNNFQYVECDE